VVEPREQQPCPHREPAVQAGDAERQGEVVLPAAVLQLFAREAPTRELALPQLRVEPVAGVGESGAEALGRARIERSGRPLQIPFGTEAHVGVGVVALHEPDEAGIERDGGVVVGRGDAGAAHCGRVGTLDHVGRALVDDPGEIRGRLGRAGPKEQPCCVS